MRYPASAFIAKSGSVLLAWAFLAISVVAGCGTDAPSRGSCGEDGVECPDGEYCNEEGTCASDCEPGAGECGTGMECNENGRCVGLPCENDGDCGEDRYCDETCQQDCDPETGAGCATGESCSDDGKCVLAGECLEDGDCDDPPSSRCDGDTRISYKSDGSCDQTGTAFSCEYETREKSCGWGCRDGECIQCDSNACDDPPESECADENTLTTYGEPSMCESGGECIYTPSQQDCPHGCSNGACESGPCENLSCDDPPAAKCDDNIVVTYDEEGTCETEGEDGTVCNYNANFEHCSYTGATCEEASCVEPVGQEGTVVFTELMADPDGVRDRQGEWVEVYNPDSEPVDLQGWTLASEGNNDHTIDESVTVPAEGRAVLAVSGDPLDEGSVSPDYVYDGIFMSNGSDWLRLKNTDGAIVDHLFYEAGAMLAGHSRKLDPSATTSATANDNFDNWCPSLANDELLESGDDYGTPGSENLPCEQTPCDTFQCEKPTGFCRDADAVRPTRDEATCEVSRFHNPACDFDVRTFNCTDQELCVTGFCESLPQNAPGEGDLVITELMGNPATISDSSGEWIEVYNPTSQTLSLFSLVLEDGESGGAKDAYTIVETNAEIEAKSYAVLAVETDPNENGGIPGPYHYEGSHLKNSPDGMTISLVRQDGTVIDEAHYGSAEEGAAQQLDLNAYKGASSPAANNDGASNWCRATSSYHPDNNGTPGADNAACE